MAVTTLGLAHEAVALDVAGFKKHFAQDVARLGRVSEARVVVLDVVAGSVLVVCWVQYTMIDAAGPSIHSR